MGDNWVISNWANVTYAYGQEFIIAAQGNAGAQPVADSRGELALELGFLVALCQGVLQGCDGTRYVSFPQSCGP